MSTKRDHLYRCRLCCRHHPLSHCPDFLLMSAEVRRRSVAKFRYCLNCLAHSHLRNECKSLGRCIICHEKHHSLLHPKNNASSAQRDPSPSRTTKPATSSAQGPIVLMPTAHVKIRNQRSNHSVRALIDPCSEHSLISAELVDKLKLRTWTCGDHQMCSVTISAHFDATCTLELDVQSCLLRYFTPLQSVNWNVPKRFDHVVLADSIFHLRSSCELVLGGDVYPKVIRSGVLPEANGAPMAQNSIFGYLVTGPVFPSRRPSL